MSKSARFCLVIGAGFGVAYVVTFIGIALVRLTFGFDLEWMEGGMVTHAGRLLNGLPIYTQPSVDFVPFFYTPGYPALLAGLASVTGELSLSIARGVSLVASLSTLGMIYWVVKSQASRAYGLIAIGTYAALFRTNGAFYDLARPDALCIALILAGALLAQKARSLRWVLLSGLVFVVAFFTKQTSSVFVPAVGLYLLWRNWRLGLAFIGISVGTTSLGVYWMNETTDGWFWSYIFEGHQRHVFIWGNILLEYWRDLLFLAPAVLLIPLLWFSYRVPVVGLSVLLAAHWTYAFIARAQTLDYPEHMYYRELFYEDPRWLILIPPAVIALLCLVVRFTNRQGIPLKTDPFWLLMFVAGVGASGLNHSTQWAYSNCFMLVSVFAAILIPLAIRDLMGDGAHQTRFGWLVMVAMIAQFVCWGYDPRAQVPTDDDVRALGALDARIAKINGPIFFPAHPLHSYRRDGVVHLHQMGIRDVAHQGGIGDLQARLRDRKWGAVIMDERLRLPGLERSYYVGHRLRYENNQTLRSKTGFLVRPSTIWYPQRYSPRMVAAGITGNFEGGRLTGWHGPGAPGFSGKATRGRNRGQEGRYALVSSLRGVGAIRSHPFKLIAPRLSFLMGARGRGGGLRVFVDDRVVATERAAPQRRVHLRRGSIDLERYVGQPIQVEAFDDDARGRLYVDDLRMVQ